MKYFRIKEFDSDIKGSGKNMDINFLRFIDELRKRCEFPFIVTSGYRTPEHNKRVGGIENSAHTKGLACDIAMIG